MSYTQFSTGDLKLSGECFREISHYGPCGVCSSAQDLAAIMDPFLSIKSFICTREGYPYKTYGDFERTRDCLLGEEEEPIFTQACAELWASNGINNAKLGCESVCLRRLALCLPQHLCPRGKTCIGIEGCYMNPPNPATCCLAAPEFNPNFNDPGPDCSLDKCLDCDDKKSNEIFTLVAGRTSRRSGLITATPIDFDDNDIVDQWVGLKRPCESIKDVFHSGWFIPSMTDCRPN